MKPAFALDFRDDSIRLLHRSGSTWRVIGATPLDAPDLSEALNYLRSTAAGLSPRGISTKLIIPNDQILYTWVAAEGADADSLRVQVAAALEGRTPYGVEELEFDYHGSGPELLVAVIAKETLAEAEAFAVEHRFNPVSFVAVPDDAAFGGEAWFGPSSYAAELLQPGEAVERDAEAVVAQSRGSVAASPAPEAEPVDPAPEAEPVDPAPKAEPVDLAPEPEPESPETAEVSEAAQPAPVKPEPEASSEATLAPAEPEPADQPDLPLIDTSVLETETVLDEPSRSTAAEAGPTAGDKSVHGVERVIFPEDPEDNRALAEALGRSLSKPLPSPPQPEPPAIKRRAALSEPEVEEAPMALDVPSEDPADTEPQGAQAVIAALTAQGADAAPKLSARVIDPRIEDDLPPPPSGAALAAFSSRRQAGGPSAKAPSLGAAPRDMARPSLTAPAPLQKSGAPAAAKPEKSGKSKLRGLGALVKPSAKPNGAAPAAAAKAAAPKPLADIAAAVAAPPITPATPAKPAVLARRTDLNRGPGGFGQMRSAPVRGKPRYLGLFLTVLLLFLLAMVAAWSSYTLGAWNTTDEATVQTAADGAEGDAGAATSGDAPDATDEMLADLQDPDAMTIEVPDDQPLDLTADATAPEAQDLATLETVPEDQPDPAAEDQQADLEPATELPTAAPKTEVSTELSSAPNPTSGTQDEIYLATVDPPPAAPDPLTLQQPEARGDPLPDTQAAPPPFGTVYQFTADGVIRPTPEGIITPEGVLLVAGKPEVVPPERPEAVTALAVATKSASSALASTVSTEPAPAELIPASPTMIGAKPKQRPEGLAPPAPSDQGSLAPAQGSRFASLRPLPRPKSATSAAELAKQAAAAATLSTAPPASDAVAPASKLAVSISRKPAARPKDMSRAVEAAVAAAVRTPAPKETAAIAPEDDGEPELARVAPKIPTKASVAKQATFANVLNLSQYNLIGIYGTQNKRYALIRQPNGRYKKVKVGDSLDNGKIVAITASELRYQKRGKLVALAMPKT